MESVILKNFTDTLELWYPNSDIQPKLNTVFAFEGDQFSMRGNDIFEGNRDCYLVNADLKMLCLDENHSHIIADFKKLGIELVEKFEFYEKTSAIRQINTIKNKAKEPKILSHISSARIRIDVSGELRWDDPERFKVWYCLQGWTSEGQWKSASLRDFGMAPSHMGWTRTSGKFRSKGSWTTCCYYPLLIIEDLEKGKTYFIENESGGTWEFHLGKMDDALFIDSNSCNIDHDGWYYSLKPGDTFTTRASVYGMVEGGFEDAVRELTEYKRTTAIKAWKDRTPLVCFNEYMSSAGKPNAEVIPMITAAKNAGCEVFCIDAGWFREDDSPRFYGLGEYVISDKRFSPYTFADIINHIKDSGMIPGIWFEFEAVSDQTENYYKDGYILKRNGVPLGGARGFYDFTNPKVRRYLLDAVSKVYNLGVRYIKNDYNQTTGVGFGNHSQNYSVESMKQVLAFYGFIEELYAEFPDIIVENCSSGAMRSDNATLSRFAVQSISDQEEFYNYPSIIQGSLSQMPPEKAGIWAVSILKENSENVPESLNDEEAVTFRMVSGMMGSLYMSGFIDYADEKCFSLIKEGIDTYKTYRSFVGKATPVYPSGFFPLGDKGFASLGLYNKEEGRLILAVWKIDAESDSATFELGKYLPENTKVKMLYPAGDAKCTYSFNEGKLKVEMPEKRYMARIFDFIF